MTGCPCPPHTDQHTAETGAGLAAYEAWRATAPAHIFDDSPRPAAGRLADRVQHVGELMRVELGDTAPLFVYGQPNLEADVRAALTALPGARGFLSPVVPPGRLYVAAAQLDDPPAREVTP